VPAPGWTTEVSREGSTVTTRSPVLIDVGAAGKGYLVDLVGEILHEHDVDEFVIDASGDLLVSSALPRRIALEHPFDPSLAIGVVELRRGSICASGSNRRVWGEGLHHILDGRTGEPTRDVIATWAIAETALVADGLATALFFAPPSKLAETFEFDYVRMFANGRAEHSAGLDGELFS
jgi:thiamine biosynthesis lipoprotein